MQHLRLIDSGGGGCGSQRFFAGGDSMRLRPHHHDLKCPRCDSLNTKFCYYNNYNLSQPRHFCKSCRRYWTKGGVLRNIPVGGAVRKPKRSGKPKSKSNPTPSSAVAVERKSSNSENSSSASSRTTENTNSTPATLVNFSEPSKRFFTFTQSSTPITTFNSVILNQSSTTNRSPEIGSFTTMITPSTDDQLPSEFNTTAGIPSFKWTDRDLKMPEMRLSALMEQTAEIEYEGLGCRRSNGGHAGKDDWGNSESVDEGLMFDLTGTVDQAYWSQSQWNDDQRLNFFS